MTLKPIVHEIRIQNQVIFLDPPIEYARSTWIQQLHDWLGRFVLDPVYPHADSSRKVSFAGCGVFKVLGTKSVFKCKVLPCWRRRIFHW